MLYDVFISHAGEDKDAFVRPLAECLRRHRVEVWYDEFTLTAGMSLRRSIDLGLSKSRHGIIILSPHFFGKAWPEWELNGLVQRHLAKSQSVLLPIWHLVTRDTVAAYSPSLADIVAIPSSVGLEVVVARLLKVLQPVESALVTARNIILERGYEPPVISDDWWLDAIEGAGYQSNQRWCFPIWKMSPDPVIRGENLAWTVMQHIWQEEAVAAEVTQLSPPREVVKFIIEQPGLREACERMIYDLLEFVPQLAIPGFGGPLESAIEAAYQQSVIEQERLRSVNHRGGSALTINGLCPACDALFALRHPAFGDYHAANLACGYVQGHGAGLGPLTRAYPAFDYLVWFLSSKSDWLPRRHHRYLLQGMKDWNVWPWFETDSDPDHNSPEAGALCRWLLHETGRSKRKLADDALTDLQKRIRHSQELLGLPESTQDLVDRFFAEKIIEAWFSAEKGRAGRRARSGAGVPKFQ